MTVIRPVLLTILIAAGQTSAANAQPSAIAQLQPHVQARVTCSIHAADRYGLPTSLLIAIAEQEGGRIGQWVKNANGSYDVGPMQFNTAYLQTLEHHGIAAQDVEAPGCYPFDLAAWRIRRHMDRDHGDIWTRAANYHSRTPARNARYRAAIRARADKWSRWLDEHALQAQTTLSANLSPSDLPPLPPSRAGTVTTILSARPSDRAPVRESNPAVASLAPSEPSFVTDSPGKSNARLVTELASNDARLRAQLLHMLSSRTQRVQSGVR